MRLRRLQLVIACRIADEGSTLSYVMSSLSPQQNILRKRENILEARNLEPRPAPPYSARPPQGVRPISPEPRYLRHPYLIYHIRDGGGEDMRQHNAGMRRAPVAYCGGA